jgi:ankyrin repeat protein
VWVQYRIPFSSVWHPPDPIPGRLPSPMPDTKITITPYNWPDLVPNKSFHILGGVDYGLNIVLPSVEENRVSVDRTPSLVPNTKQRLKPSHEDKNAPYHEVKATSNERVSKEIDVCRTYTTEKLHGYCKNGEISIGCRAIRNGGDINRKDAEGYTLLIVAIQSNNIIHGNYELLDLLLTKGADLEARDGNGNTALLLACSSAKSIHCVPRLVGNSGNGVHEWRSDLRARNDEGFTALHLIARHGFSDVKFIANLLLDRGADIEAIDRENSRSRPIHLACKCGNSEVTEISY